jgi:hypothetical protein
MGAIKGQQSKKWTPAMRAAAALRARQLAERQRLAQQQADAAAVSAPAPAPVPVAVAPVATPMPSAPASGAALPDNLPVQELADIQFRKGVERGNERFVIEAVKMGSKADDGRALTPQQRAWLDLIASWGEMSESERAAYRRREQLDLMPVEAV